MSDPLFWAKVDVTDGCWTWTGYTNSDGYGRLHRPKYTYAHRYSWFLHYGDPGEFRVLHRCDNPPCVRPDHLFLGTQQDNVKDMASKGRHGMSTLTNEQVEEIRSRVAAGEVQRHLAAEYGVHPPCISRIVNGYRRG